MLFFFKGLGSPPPKRNQVHAMVLTKDIMIKLWIVVLYVSIATSIFIHCDARISRFSNVKDKQHQVITNARSTASSISVQKKLKALRHLDLNNPTLDDDNANAPNSLPNFDGTLGSLPPSYLSHNTPPYCIYPPFTPLPPSTTVPTPLVYAQPPPPPSSFSTPTLPLQGPPPPPGILPNPPEYAPTPPTYVPGPPSLESSPPPPSFEPSPPEYVPGPPEFEPSPPEYVRSPPAYVPGPPEFGPSPPVYVPSPRGFLPPIVFPPPIGPPSNSGTGIPLWCVAKPTVPDPIIQEAMNYACGSGADCESIQPDGSCYNPDKLISHASYAFNSYWQRTKASGGTCDFGGTAILISKDPSFDGCHFIVN